MKIKLNKIEFDVVGIPSDLRAVLLKDPVIAQGVWREIWKWDHGTQTGTMVARLTEKKALPLPNGMSFFVPKAGAEGRLVQNEGPSKLMAKRVVEQVGAKSITDLLNALQRILGIAQRTIPFDQFKLLNPVASYTIRMHTEFNVVQLREASRNLSAYLFVPGQVGFMADVTERPDIAAFDKVMADNPKLVGPQPAYVVPAQSQANQNARMIALARRIEELQPLIAAATEGGKPLEDIGLRNAFGRTVSEWRALQPKPAAQTARA